MSDVVAHRVVVHGRVQGVFFRASARDRAEQLGVAGWVRNHPDGTVEAHLEGAPGAVEELEDWMRSGGPPRAEVTGVDVQDVGVTGAGWFEVR